MPINNHKNKGYSSARGGRVYRVAFAPPLLIFAFFGVSILLQIPIGLVMDRVSFSLGMLLNQVGTLLIPVFIVIRFFSLSKSVILPFHKISIYEILIAIIMMLSVAVITDYLVFITESIFPIKESLDVKYERLMQVKGFFSYIYKLGLLCLLPGFCEEIFFRGFCQTGLERKYGRWPGILIVAGMFAIAHLNPWYVHLYFMLGI